MAGLITGMRHDSEHQLSMKLNPIVRENGVATKGRAAFIGSWNVRRCQDGDNTGS